MSDEKIKELRAAAAAAEAAYRVAAAANDAAYRVVDAAWNEYQAALEAEKGGKP